MVLFQYEAKLLGLDKLFGRMDIKSIFLPIFISVT